MRYPNKRIGGRAANGRFTRLTFADVFGVEENADTMVCDNCGHQWIPLVKSGICPKCGGHDKHPVPPPEITPEIQAKIDAYLQIRNGGFIDPRRVHEAVALERELQPWIKAGLIHG
ncbi:MAG: zinc ribbon-containing protein [Acidobacteria bacterium]|nr:zinc ribbon-containing protein [Acidobacteriota bacterium]